MQPKPKKKDGGDPRCAIVDEIGDLEAELAPLKPKQARLDLLRASLRASYDDKPAADSFQVEGNRFVVIVGGRGDQKIVNILKLFKRIRAKLFLQIASVTLKAVEALPPDVELECVSKSVNTGPRTLKVFAKGRAA